MWEMLEIEPPKELYHRILTQITLAKRRRVRIRLSLLSVTIAGSAVALIPAAQYTVKEFAQSGFYQYLLLAFSDSGTLALYWREYMFTLVESLPLIGVTLVLSGIFVLLGSLKLALKNYELQRNYTIKSV